ncbi:hypothetical protein EKO27_g5905 [Xylaria grammica]|uniref:NACHT domain-containing protein n=1 Tax=Xylaria grammica TaxID=363999 RepID=A0A439D458_9PEZI|nr:hypothetical protein EKO27_g5905 [Xylaria grammica]
MADPITTLSLASCILQVIDFASGFATTAWKIYRAADRSREGLDAVVELRNTNSNLAAVLREIQSQANVSREAVTNGSDGIVSLARECAVLVEELLQTLPPETNITRKRDAIRVAFKLKWKSEDIRNLQSRLAEFKSQLTINLLVSMRQYASQSLAQQENILERISSIDRKPGGLGSLETTSHAAERIGSSVLEYVTSKLSPAAGHEQRRFLQSKITQAIQSSPGNDAVDGSWSPNLFIPRGVRADALNNLLASLNYAGMDDREWGVAEAHHATFRWLFDENESPSRTSFKNWLASEEKLYWITGKAGSGKSTLMKYISHPGESRNHYNKRPRCHDGLLKWCGKSNLVIASFYFWNSGTHMQATQKGLMMTLLQQILKQCPDLAPIVFPSRWEMLCLFGGYTQDWDEGELRDSFRHAIANVQNVGAKIALFIDGLDEFEGKPEELITFLQNFNLRDQEEQYADALVESVVSVAQGVFLWVALVVSSLISGLSSGDRISDLKERLALLPPDLEGLYEKILLSLDPFYLEHAAQLFSLVAASREPMNVVVASFADEKAPDVCLHHRIQEMSEADIQRCVDTMHRRLNSRTKGLLEVQRPGQAHHSNPLKPEDFTIQYLHRTVKDYVEGENARTTLRSSMKSSFDPHLRLLAGLVTYIKTLNEGEITMIKIGRYLFACMESAREVVASSIPSMVVLIDEMDKVISALWKRTARFVTDEGFGEIRESREKGLWALDICPTPVTSIWDQQYFGHTLLSLAVACNVVEYVRARTPPSCFVKKPCLNSRNITITYEPWPLLMDAISMNSHFRCGGPDDPYLNTFGKYFTHIRDDHSQFSLIPMLECLLSKGADPAYLVSLGPDPGSPGGEMRTSLLIEMVAHMMQTQNQTLTAAARLLVRTTTVDEEILARIIRRFRARIWYRVPIEYGRFNRLCRRIIDGPRRFGPSLYADPSRKMMRHLKFSLENLRNEDKSIFRVNYEQVIGVPEYSIAQLVIASQLNVRLTLGAKYHAPVWGRDLNITKWMPWVSQ